MMNLVPGAALFQLEPLIEADVDVILCPTVGFLRVNKTKKTSSSALKKGSGSLAADFKSTRCMRPSLSGTKLHRWSDSTLNGEHKASEAANIKC